MKWVYLDEHLSADEEEEEEEEEIGEGDVDETKDPKEKASNNTNYSTCIEGMAWNKWKTHLVSESSKRPIVCHGTIAAAKLSQYHIRVSTAIDMPLILSSINQHHIDALTGIATRRVIYRHPGRPKSATILSCHELQLSPLSSPTSSLSSNDSVEWSIESSLTDELADQWSSSGLLPSSVRVVPSMVCSHYVPIMIGVIMHFYVSVTDVDGSHENRFEYLEKMMYMHLT
jgi:hypothetical protein